MPEAGKQGRRPTTKMHVGLFGRDGTTLYHDGAGSFISDSACRNSCNDTAKISNFGIICFTSISLTLGKIHIQYHTIFKKHLYIYVFREIHMDFPKKS